MLKLLKESFKITNNCIIIATPLILFSLIASLYLIFSTGGNSFGQIATMVLFFLMLGAFLSGWFSMISTVVKNPPEKPAKDYSMLSEFPSGVGEYFLCTLGFIIFTFIVSSIILIISVLLGKHYIGSAGFTYAQMLSASANIESMRSFIDSLSQEQIIKINKWNILLLATMIFNYFVIMFYAPALYIKNKNPLFAFIISLRDLLSRKIITNIVLFILLFISYTILSILNVIFGNNIIMHFILTLVNFYYITYSIILVFNYYYTNFAKIGSEIDEIV